MERKILTTAWWDELRRGVDSLNYFKDNQLAYLCLTSKPENIIRDQVAMYLEANTNNADKAVSREWTSSHVTGRTDLAVVDVSNQNNEPELAVEFKVYGLLEELDGIKPRHRREMLSDIEKLRKLIDRKGVEGSQPVCYFVLIHQTLRDIVPSNLLDVVKYARRSNRALEGARLSLQEMQNACNDNARQYLEEVCGVDFANGEWIRIDAGNHWGIGVDLDVLIGQVGF